MGSRTLHRFQTNFTAGELDPKLAARHDFKPYFNGASYLRNFAVRPQGGVFRRNGSERVADLFKISTSVSPGGAGVSYPEGNTGGTTYDAYLSGTTHGDDAGLITPAISGMPVAGWVMVQYDLLASYTVHCVDVHNAFISPLAGVGIWGTLYVEYFNGSVWVAFPHDTTIGHPYATSFLVIDDVSAQWRRFVYRTGVSARYWRIRYTHGGGATTGSVNIGAFRLWQISAQAHADAPPRLVPFSFNDQQQYVFAFTDGNAAIFRSDGSYLANMYSHIGRSSSWTTEGPMLRYTQSADKLLLAEEQCWPQEMIRWIAPTGWGVADVNWVPRSIRFTTFPRYDFVPTTTTRSATLSCVGTTGVQTITASAGTFTSGDANQYIEVNGGYGRVLRYNTTTSIDVLFIIPMYGVMTAVATSYIIYGGYEDAWSTTRLWPRSCCFYEGRLWFGGSYSRPQSLWGSRVDDFYDFDIGQGLDDEAIEGTLDTDQVNRINNAFPGRDLQIFTSGGEFYLPTAFGQPITPATLSVKRQTSRGSEEGIPVVEVDGGTLFIQLEGKALREFLFSDLEQSYNSNNLTLLSSHLLNSPVDMCLRTATATDESDLVFVVNGDGTVAVMNTLRSQDITAWSKFDTLGTYRSVCSLRWGDDPVWTCANRTIGASQLVCLERFKAGLLTDCGYVVARPGGGWSSDGGGRYYTDTRVAGAAALVVIGDGVYLGTVAADGAGKFYLGATPTVSNPASIEYGLLFIARLITMPLEFDPQGQVRHRLKRIVNVQAYLHNSSGVIIQGEACSAGPGFTGIVEASGLHGFTQDGLVTVEQIGPSSVVVLGLDLTVGV